LQGPLKGVFDALFKLRTGLFKPIRHALVSFVFFVVSAESWKWEKTSIVHREKFIKLSEYRKTHPEDIKEVNGVHVCCLKEFLIGKGSDGTRVYVGLEKNGNERAVKRLPRDACTGLAEQEKKVLKELNETKSNYVVKYWFLDEQSDKEYLFLILDLCEETLEHFVTDSSIDDLVKVAPDIIRQVLTGLAHLHCEPMPILHLDLKPSNILRNVHDKWLLADFGISRILTGGASTLPTTGQKGTEDWRAVESCPSNNMAAEDGKVRFKKESDIQVRFSVINIGASLECVWGGGGMWNTTKTSVVGKLVNSSRQIVFVVGKIRIR
jgi:serine/threonine protein kinase